MNRLQATMILALLATGLGAALLGSIKVHLAARLRIDEARIGGLVSLFGFTLVPVIFTAGFLTDLVGRQVVLVSGSLLLAASLGLLAMARSYLAALLAVIVLSAGWALVINVGNVLTPLAFSGGSLAHATNLANVFFGLGAFLTPLAAAVLVRRLGFPPALCVLAAFCLSSGLMALSIDFGSLPQAAGAGEMVSADPAELFRDPFLWLCGFALFFYGPLEASVGAWATTYLGEQGYREPAAAGLLSAFWLTFVAARLMTAYWLPAHCERLLIVALSAACIAVLSGMVLGRGRAAGAIMVVAAGAVFGPIFPTLVAIFLGHFAAALHGRAIGMLFAIGGIGWAVIPMLIGGAARRWGVRRGFSVAIAAAVGLTAVASAIGMMGAE